MDFPLLELTGGPTRLTIVPALGGKIASMRMGGREWLWTSDTIPRRAPDDAMRADDAVSYVEVADTGGYDECFPTVGACRLPDELPSYGGLRLPDHGELWAEPPEVTTGRGDGDEWVTLLWRGRRMPYWFTRTVHVTDDGGVLMRYAIGNENDAPLPYLWSAHPLLPLTPATRIVLPEGARVRVAAEHGIDLGGPLAEHRWPHLVANGRPLDFSRPDAVGERYACKLFLDLPAGPNTAAVEEDGARLEVHFDGMAVQNFGLWLNRRGWTPFAGGAPYLNLAFEPCIGAPDPLSDALGAWRGAHWLQGWETREWTLRWSARPA